MITVHPTGLGGLNEFEARCTNTGDVVAHGRTKSEAFHKGTREAHYRDLKECIEINGLEMGLRLIARELDQLDVEHPFV